MHTRATVAVISAALGISALTAPTALAKDAPRAQLSDTTVSNVVVNEGKPVSVGTTTKRKITVTFTAGDSSGIRFALASLWRGKSYETLTNILVGDTTYAMCGSGSKPVCKQTFTVDPGILSNEDAGTWRVWVTAYGTDLSSVEKENTASFSIKRTATLSTNASPEPVASGSTLTVSGTLRRANWTLGSYTGYSGQPVALQFRRSGSSTYSTVKTVKTDSEGKLRTKVKASRDGTYRFSFAGTSTTAPANAGGDSVDVR
ncbi:calcium-binding protein [Streptomyces sp. NPDC057638]|uniref:calcium-binding protein n=1 Tax=Streptomyces sp. NPDC057638 TaxID=3346190 RepID=UPI0036C5CBDF